MVVVGTPITLLYGFEFCRRSTCVLRVSSEVNRRATTVPPRGAWRDDRCVAPSPALPSSVLRSLERLWHMAVAYP